MEYYDEYLEHHGIKGQRWGVRRFQKEDGSVTPAGKARYYGDKDSFKASNGIKVGAPKNAGVAAFRKFQATKVGGGMLTGMAKANKAISVGSKAKAGWDRIGKQIEKENQAVRESEKAHRMAVNSEKETKRQAKEGFKERYKENLKETREKATLKDKLIYNDATRKRAAKLMTKYKDMDYNKATETAKKEAKRNTAIVLAAYGAIQVGALVASSKMNNSKVIYGPGDFMTNVGNSMNFTSSKPHTGKLKL